MSSALSQGTTGSLARDKKYQAPNLKTVGNIQLDEKKKTRAGTHRPHMQKGE